MQLDTLITYAFCWIKLNETKHDADMLSWIQNKNQHFQLHHWRRWLLKPFACHYNMIKTICLEFNLIAINTLILEPLFILNSLTGQVTSSVAMVKAPVPMHTQNMPLLYMKKTTYIHIYLFFWWQMAKLKNHSNTMWEDLSYSFRVVSVWNLWWRPSHPSLRSSQSPFHLPRLQRAVPNGGRGQSSQD